MTPAPRDRPGPPEPETQHDDPYANVHRRAVQLLGCDEDAIEVLSATECLVREPNGRKLYYELVGDQIRLTDAR